MIRSYSKDEDRLPIVLLNYKSKDRSGTGRPQIRWENSLDVGMVKYAYPWRPKKSNQNLITIIITIVYLGLTITTFKKITAYMGWVLALLTVHQN